MLIAGIGCRSGVSAEAVLEALSSAARACHVEERNIDAIATASAKAGERGITEAAARLRLPVILVDAQDMERAAAGALTASTSVLALKGVPSVAETAALAAAGTGARLLAPRTATATATCAIASGADA